MAFLLGVFGHMLLTLHNLSGIFILNNTEDIPKTAGEVIWAVYFGIFTIFTASVGSRLSEEVSEMKTNASFIVCPMSMRCQFCKFNWIISCSTKSHQSWLWKRWENQFSQRQEFRLVRSHWNLLRKFNNFISLCNESSFSDSCNKWITQNPHWRAAYLPSTGTWSIW